MLELKTVTKSSPISLSDELCASFKHNIMFHTTPASNFLTTHYIIDFQNKQLKSIQTHSQENEQILKDTDPTILEGIPHSVSVLNNEGFYVFPNNSAAGICFKYIDYRGKMTVLFGNDLNHPESKKWGRVSASFQAPPNIGYMLVGFHKESDNSVDIIKLDDKLNAELLFNIPNMLDAPHEMIEIENFILSTTFRLFEAHNLKTGKFYRWPKDIVDDGYDFDNPPDEIRISPGQLFVYNRDTDEVTYLTVGAPPTAHFIQGRDNIFYSTAHNLTFYKDKFHFFGPAYLTKWVIEEGKIIKKGVFFDEKGYRCTTYIHFTFEGKNYLVTLAYPNRLIFIDCDTMTRVCYHDIEHDWLSSVENTKKHINNIHRSNHESDRYCLNDINISSDGRYIVYFEKDRVNFYDFKERRVIKEKIEFPVDAASNVKILRAVMHTGLLEPIT